SARVLRGSNAAGPTANSSGARRSKRHPAWVPNWHAFFRFDLPLGLGSMSVARYRLSRSPTAAPSLTRSLGCNTTRSPAVRPEITSAARLLRERPDALFVDPDPFLTSRRAQLVHLATLHKVAAAYPVRDYAEAGGLMSYGSNITETFRQMGVYTGRILKGAKPADLPVVQSSKFELVINLKAAKSIGLNIQESFLLCADEVIE